MYRSDLRYHRMHVLIYCIASNILIAIQFWVTSVFFFPPQHYLRVACDKFITFVEHCKTKNHIFFMYLLSLLFSTECAEENEA